MYKEKILVEISEMSLAGSDPVEFSRMHGRQTADKAACQSYALGFIRETLKNIPTWVDGVEREAFAAGVAASNKNALALSGLFMADAGGFR